MAVSKVVLGDETLIDLTSDTVSEDTLLEGTTAHAANGEQITGGVVVTPMYTGTKAAIESAIAEGKIPEDAVVNITDDEETSSFQTQINEINSSLTKLKTYSTTEIDTGEKWIDGKSIYRKVITGGSISESNYIALDIGVNIDTLISASGCCTDYTGVKRNMNDSCGVSLTNWGNNKINVSTYSVAISSFTIIIEYTKIT